MACCSEFFESHWHLLRSAALFAPRSNPTFGNPPWTEAALRVLIVRLSPYGDVDRSATHLFLAQECRRAGADVFVDFCFFPESEDRALLVRSAVPPLAGISSWRSAGEFDLVLVSCSYVAELLNLPWMLARSGLPLMASERRGERPVFVLGGAAALACGSVIDEEGDAMVDAVFFGEGERRVERLVRIFLEDREAPKEARLARAAREVGGLWPAGSPAIAAQAAICSEPRAEDLVASYPVLPGSEASTARLAISYGCPYSCAFCFEGCTRKPYREVPLAELREASLRLKRAVGATRLELASFNFSTHSEIASILLELGRLFREVSLMSQRVDVLAETPGLLEAEIAAGKRGFTLGIEGVSERQRRFLDKRLEEPTIRKALAALLAARVREIKLFYVITGHESEEDFAEFRGFLGWLRSAAASGSTRLLFSFNRLLRMPFTPLAFDPAPLEESWWRPALEKARAVVEETGYEFRLAASWSEHALCQVLALGGRWLCRALGALAAEDHTYETSVRPATWQALRAWMHEHVPRAFEELAAEKPADYRFPLDFVSAASTQEALHARYRRAREALASARPAREAVEVRAPRSAVEPAAIQALRELAVRKARLEPLALRLRIPREVAGGSFEWLEAWVVRELLALAPELASGLVEVRELLLRGLADQRRGSWAADMPWFGESVFGIWAWDSSPILALAESRARSPGGLEVVGPADTAASSETAWMGLRLELAEEIFPGAGARLVETLQAAHAPVTVRRAEDGGYRLEPSARARRAHVLASGAYRLCGGLWSIELSVGRRFPLERYLARFGRGAQRRALAEVRP